MGQAWGLLVHQGTTVPVEEQTACRAPAHFTLTKNVQWFYFDNNDGRECWFVIQNVATVELLEHAVELNLSRISYERVNSNGQAIAYEVDMVNMVQWNTTSGTSRSLLRVIVSPPPIVRLSDQALDNE